MHCLPCFGHSLYSIPHLWGGGGERISDDKDMMKITKISLVIAVALGQHFGGKITCVVQGVH